MSFSDADAQRLLRVVTEQVDRRLLQTQVRYMWGIVESVDWAAKTARVYLLGETTNYSSGFRFLDYEGPVVGQPVLAAVHPNGDRWIERVGGRSGATFPTSPASGQRFYRTDRNIEYFWDGTRWLGTSLKTTQFAVIARPSQGGNLDFSRFTVSEASAFRMARPVAQGVHIWLENFDCAFHDASANNNPMFWGVNLYAVSGGTRTQVWGRQDFGMARSSWSHGMTVSAGGWAPLAISDAIFEVDLSNANSAGALNVLPFIQWREVG